MAKEFKYVVRGRCRMGHRYKIVNGSVKRFGEARGEDQHDSRFQAITFGAATFQAWRMRPQGLSLDVHEIEVS